MGTQLQALDLSVSDWQGKEGCSEILNVSVPEKIEEIHKAYFDAGSDVVETNTFGANRIVLDEYGLADRVRELNRIAATIARRAADASSGVKPRFVAGSIGPGTRLPSLGQTSFDVLHGSYFEQARGLLDGGVDLFIIETCQDPLQIKAALIAVIDAKAERESDIPVIVSVTVETTGTLLVGSELGVIITALAPFNIDALGLNCATGPDKMRPYVKRLCEDFPGPVIVQPNAGLPANKGGRLAYDYDKHVFADILRSFVEEEGVSIVGGCCGTTPEFIRAISSSMRGATITPRKAAAGGGEHAVRSVASIYTSVPLGQDPPPFFVGERTNTNGSQAFKKKLLAEDWDGIVEIAREQKDSGAHGLDLCVAFTGRNEIRDMSESASRIIRNVDLPLFFDSTQIDVMEASLKLYGGKAVINSINLENGEGRAHQICRIAQRYGAALIALVIDEKGMALEPEKKLAVAKRIYDIAVKDHGMNPGDLIFDALTFTLGSGDESLKGAGISTLEGIRLIKSALPGVRTILGVSNISFGLSASSRPFLNSVFLSEAVKAGLDLAIVDVKKILPLFEIGKEELDACLALVYNRGENPLFAFIRHFESKAGTLTVEDTNEEGVPVDERVRRHVIQGRKAGMRELLPEALGTRDALSIINDLLIPAMKVVGELFGSGKMQLPFVLQSAEVMKASVDFLAPYMDKKDEVVQTSIVIATVRGDVHDIGKNLVDIILSNNGYKVYNLGIKCEIETMIDKALEVNASAIGMSGLLVKSTVVMKENLEEMKRRKIDIPVLLGGAALTGDYVDEVCAPILDSPVVYCADAFAGLETMARIKEGTLVKTAHGTASGTKRTAIETESKEEIAISRTIDVPRPPFWGSRIDDNVDLDEVFSLITEQVLFRGRWGYRRGAMSREEYEALIRSTVRPEYEALKKKCKDEQLIVPRLAYGYWPANADGDDVVIYSPEGGSREIARLRFPRQDKAPHLCVADFFYPADSGIRDMIALQVATVGSRASEISRELYESNEYRDYLLFHGLSVEAAEALAELSHKNVRRQLGILEQDGSGIEDFVVQKYRGSRYSFGYPACPDLRENRKILALLEAERIGVTVTDEDQMVPEQTTSAFIVHHPQAKYFKV